MVTRRQILKTAAIAGLQGASLNQLHAQVCPPKPEFIFGGEIPPVSDVFKAIVTCALSYIPEVGSIISVMADLLWPDPEVDIWGQIKDHVEDLIDQKLDKLVYEQLSRELHGLGEILPLYVQAVKDGDLENIRGYFRSVNTAFTASAAKFQIKEFEWLLAPLFAIFAQMHLTLLREGILHGKQWHWSKVVYERNRTQLREAKTKYAQYLNACVDRQRKLLSPCEPASPGQHMTALYNYWQPFEAYQIQMIDDYIRLMDLYRDTPDSTDINTIQFADVYSAAFGTADDFDATCRERASSVVPAYYAPLSAISTIDVELFNNSPRVVNVNYPPGTGPVILNQQGKRTDQSSIIGRRQAGVQRYTVKLPSPLPHRRYNIESAIVRAASIPLAVTLVASDGSQHQLWNRYDLGGAVYSVSVPGRMLTSLNMWTYSNFYQHTLGCILFGFSRDQSDVSEYVKERLFIAAVRQPELDNPYLPDKINPRLLAKRNLHWTHVQQRVRQINGR